MPTTTCRHESPAMKLNVTQETKHSEAVGAVSWSSQNESYSCSDDGRILRWSQTGESQTVLCNFEGGHFTRMEWYPLANKRQGSQTTDIFILSGCDGTFRLISKSGRVEKVVEAHKGAVTDMKWNHEGSAIATCGEDGFVKIWSRAGMLRSTLLNVGKCVYGLCWSPEDDHILFTAGSDLVLKPVQSSSKQSQWKAHDGLILGIDFASVHGRIASCGEDGKYKVWDSYGRLLFSSRPSEYSLTSVAWCPDGELFAVGSFNHIRLCDKTGFSLSSVPLNSVGSLYSIAWTGDGTELVAGGSSGTVIFGQLIDRTLDWKNFHVALAEPCLIHVFDVSSGHAEHLDFRDRVVKMSIGHDHLVVATASQCVIYNVKNFHTPHMFDLKDPISLLLQSEGCFLTVDNASGIQVYTYEGRLVSNPKFTGLRTAGSSINNQTLSLSPDSIAVVDRANPRNVALLDVQTGQLVQQIQHSMDVVQVSLSSYGSRRLRKLAFVDRNRDLYVCRYSDQQLEKGEHAEKPFKLATMVDSFLWHGSSDQLCAVGDGKFFVWYYTHVVFVDRDLIPRMKYVKDPGAADFFGSQSQVIEFGDSHATIRRADGASISVSVCAYTSMLYQLQSRNKWNEAVRLCRFIRDPAMWACLAAMAVQDEKLDTAEIAYAALDEVDKLQYILYIKEIPSTEGRNAELALFRRQPREAERILVDANLIYRAIKLHIRRFDWDRALDLAIQHKTHVDTVVAYRQKYLKEYGQQETDKRFKQYTEKLGGGLDWTVIKQKIKEEKDKEKQKQQAKAHR